MLAREGVGKKNFDQSRAIGACAGPALWPLLKIPLSRGLSQLPPPDVGCLSVLKLMEKKNRLFGEPTESKSGLVKSEACQEWFVSAI